MRRVLGQYRLVAAAALLALLAACETPAPQPPLMSPLEATQRYGYAERPLGGDRYEVTYVGPLRRTSRFGSERVPDAAAAVMQATDFAVWRAAQLAQERGLAGFRVGQTRSNVETYVESYPDDPFYGPPYFGWGRARWGYPYFSPYPYSYRTFAYLQPSVVADVTLLRSPGAGDQRAAEVIEEMRRRYPTAESIILPAS